MNCKLLSFGLSVLFFATLVILPLEMLNGQTKATANDVVALNRIIEFELIYEDYEKLNNPFVDIHAEAILLHKDSHAKTRIDGFYDGDGTWKFRFVPRTEGAWVAELSLARTDKNNAENELGISATKKFECQTGTDAGFLEINPANPYRLQYANGTPFYPIGIQPCGAEAAGLDGPPKPKDEQNRRWQSLPMDDYLQEFSGAANLFRLQLGVGTRAGCARELINKSLGLYRYDLEACRLLDKTYSLLDKHGFSTILIPFQDMSHWHEDNTAFGPIRSTEGWKNIENREQQKPVRHYLRYLIARYGAMTDIWELFNEDSYTPDAWLADTAAFVRDLDPYDHLLTTNYERPLAAWNDIITAHMYVAIPAWETEGHLTRQFARLKSFGKPVINTEFGNKGWLSNRDPVKWRVAVWTAYMNEAGVTFWSMGGRLIEADSTRTGGNSNAYLGREAREYFRHHLNFVKDLPGDMRPVLTGYLNGSKHLSRYGLSNGKWTVLYLQHNSDHETSTQDGVYIWTGPGKFEIQWYDTATGKYFKTEEAQAAGNLLSFETPEVTTDLAAKIKRIE